MTRKDEIRARLERVTPGPWKVYKDDLSDDYESDVMKTVATGIHDVAGYEVVSSDGGLFPWNGARKLDEANANAELIANAPADINYLLKENQQLQASIRKIQQYVLRGTSRSAILDICDEALQPKENDNDT